MTLRDELERVIGAALISSNRRAVPRQDLEYSVRVCHEFFRDHGSALLEALRAADPAGHVRFLEEAEDTTSIPPRLHSYDATGRKESVYVIWPGGEGYYYIRADLADRAIDRARGGET